MKLIATPIRTCPETGINAGRTAAKLIATYGCDSVIVARRWAEVAALTGNIARGHNWRRIVDVVERQFSDDSPGHREL